jgi:hypothetical protein
MSRDSCGGLYGYLSHPTNTLEKEELKEELMNELKEITQIQPNDPQKLVTYKTTLCVFSIHESLQIIMQLKEYSGT